MTTDGYRGEQRSVHAEETRRNRVNLSAPHSLSLVEASSALRKGVLSVGELAEDVLARCDAVENVVKAWAFRADPEELLGEAAQLQDCLTECTSPLHGVPFAAKDMIDTKDLPTEGGSAVLVGRQPARDAACIQAAKRLGGLLVGKAHTHEFAFGVRTPQTNNPWNRLRTAGGSSGGSAAAVASGMVTWAYGTDTLGSVRMPAAMCGVVGLKPTTGLMETTGMLPLAPTLDTLGFLVRTIADAYVLLREFRDTDPTELEPRPLRVGILDDESMGNVEPGVAGAVHTAMKSLLCDHHVEEVTIPRLSENARIGSALLAPEAAAWHRQFLDTCNPPYGEEILASLRSGLEIPAVAYVDARSARRRLQDEYVRIFEDIDVLVTPSAPYVAPLADAPYVSWPDETTELLETSMCRFTAGPSITGLPAVSVPVGLSDGLPVGAQVIAPWNHEADALRIAESLETRLPLRP